MGKKRALVWKDYDFSEDGKLAFCKDCGSQFVSKGTDGTAHVTRHREICVGRRDGAPPPIAAPPTIPAAHRKRKKKASIPTAPPPSALPESSHCSEPASWEEATTASLARQDGAPPPVASPPTIPSAPPPGVSPESSNFSKAANQEEATADLARMIVLHGYDPSFLEDSYFRSFVHKLNPDFQVPSRAAIEDICDGVCDEANGVLRSELERTSGEVNLSIDTAETALGKVLYAACHFIDDDWNRRLMILDVNAVVPEGMSPIQVFVQKSDADECDVVKRSDKIGHLVSDRVFSMTTRRTGHLDAFLKVARYETAYSHNHVLQIVASCFFNNIDSGFAKEVYVESSVVWNRQMRGEFYSQLGLDHLLLHDKQWISFYFSLKLIRKKYPSSQIGESEVLMCNVFGEIYRASKTISEPNRPTSNSVLRELFKVRETLQSSLADASRDKSDLYNHNCFKDDIIDVLKKAEEILDLSIKKEYLQWSIPLVLDPRYKLKYIKFLFSRAFSSEAEQYIDKIIGEIKELFTSFSTDDGETTDAGPIHETEITGAHQLQQAWAEHRQCSQVTKTELDCYLEDPLVEDTEDFDILNWWKLNSSKYPTLARIARAALAMPTCSKLSSEQMSQITSIFRGYTKGILH